MYATVECRQVTKTYYLWHMNKLLATTCFAVTLLAACKPSTNPNGSNTAANTFNMQPSVFNGAVGMPPHPEKKNKELISPSGEKRIDEYYWLNERDNPEVTNFLKSENDYAEKVMAPVANLREKLFDEMKARIKEDDNSVPYFKKDYWYYSRFETGKEYPIYCRRKGTMEASEEIMLNVNALAEGKAYCSVSGMNVSPDNHLLVYAADYTGRNLYRAHIRDLQTGKDLTDEWDSAFGSSVWSKDSKFVFYDTKDATTLRTDHVWRHEVGTSNKKDVQVLHEPDETAYANLYASKDGEYAFIGHGYTQNVETHYLKLDNPTGKFEVIAPREKEAYYEVEHHNGRFIIRTNKDGRNFSVVTTPTAQPGKANWQPLIPHDAATLIDGMDVFKDFMALNCRNGGLQKIKVFNWADGGSHYVDFGEPTYTATAAGLPDFDSKALRYNFSSLKTPNSVFDYEVATKAKTLKKTEPVLGGYDPNQYTTEFIWATARDGVKVPVSVVYKKGMAKNGSAPCYQIGYGSYGSSYDPGFNKSLISLMERGFVCAIAHIRGGMEMGFEWYENGKMMKKMNTFTDFIDCSEMLIKEKYTTADRLFAQGGSAGGLLMGAVANMRPDLYKGMIASVPFVDVLTTMSDASIPLTTGEYTEWGNPAIKEQFDYMKTYSPYDNVKKQAYPNMLVKTSLADSQVQYFEPAKWVARLRDNKTDNNLLLFVTNMSGSHGGASGRFERLKERAQEYAWMLGLLGQVPVQN